MAVGDVMRPIPVSIGGVRYSSIKAAARALGVAPATVVARLKRAGEWRDKRRKPVTVAGRHFNSVREAARAFGVTPETIQNWRGRMSDDWPALPRRGLSLPPPPAFPARPCVSRRPAGNSRIAAPAGIHIFTKR